MEFLFSCSIRYLTRSLRSLVRYRVEHSKRNSISPRAHVLLSIYHTTVRPHSCNFIENILKRCVQGQIHVGWCELVQKSCPAPHTMSPGYYSVHAGLHSFSIYQDLSVTFQSVHFKNVFYSKSVYTVEVKNIKLQGYETCNYINKEY